ncbi:nSTAND1 domain-containing NTPase [Streptomyces mirabilis]|uniref:nSTAND1 domain-containing NTPase n=1 Tax=Streptomyces mirabilis TaxID=68239 RepID=UPI003660AC76
MGRPERPVDPQAGPVQQLAHELRELRRAAGGPSYRTMARAAGFSVTALSQAASGDRLPSLAVLQGYVRACGGDSAEWELRWKAAEAEAAQAPVNDEGDTSPPYRGLTRFEPDHRELFFGRDRLVEEVYELVCEHRFAVLFGASGSGKSSLLRAGLIPRLREEIARHDRPAVLRILTPGAKPASTYGHLLAPTEGEPESWVVVDQFEEVFTLCRDLDERARFIDQLLAARDPDSRLKVVIAVRADFYARCTEHRGLADALRGASLPVGPMTADELREAVVRPAQAVGLLVERELTARLVNEVLDQPGALPMLSHALLETWRRRKGRLLTLSAYEAAGGVRGAIAATAEEVYAQMSPGQGQTARQLLLRLIEPGQGNADTRRPLTRSELDEWTDPEVPPVMERLAGARLLTMDEDGVQLAHEALITSWPRLRSWIDQDRERLRHQRRLAEAARAWLEHDRDPGAVYRGTRLARAEELFTDDDSLTVTERSFLLAALEARQAEERAATRTARRSRLLLTTLSAVLAVALVAGLAAWQQHRDNERQRIDTAGRRVAAVADALRTTDPRTAMLLGVAAWRIAPLPESRRALLGALGQPEQNTFTDPAPGESPLRFLADSGRTLLSVDGRTWRRWDVTTGRLTASGRLPDGTVLAAGPDALVLSIGTADGARLWDTATGRWTGDPQPVNAIVDFGVSGHSYLVIDINDDRVKLRSVADGRVLFETRGVSQASVLPSPDDRLVAVCPTGRTPAVWDTGSHRTLPGAWQGAHGSCDDQHDTLVFTGARLAALSAHGVRVWDTASGHEVADLDDPGVQYAAFSKDGSFLATANDQEIRVWRLSDPDAPVFRHALNNQQLLYGGLAWDPARPVLRYLEGGTVHSLDLAGTVTSAWRDHPLAAEVLSPDGRILATAERSGAHYSFQLRDTRDGHVLRTLPAPPLPASLNRTVPLVPQDRTALVAFSPDSTALAYGVTAPNVPAAPQRITVWDVTHDRAHTAVDLATPTSATGVVSIALGPAGRTLYTARTPALGELSNETWDTVHHRKTAVLSGRAGSHLAVRPDGRLLVSDDRVVRAGKAVAQDLVQDDLINALAFAPDGSRLAAGDQTGRVALWDGTLRHRAGILRNVFPAPLSGLPEAVSALALSPDGRTLAVGGDAGTLQLWDTATQQPLGGPWTTPGESIDTLAFSADSATLYAASAHVPLQRYTVDTKRALTQVCARADGADLTMAQWHTYIPDAPYRKVCRD